VDKSIVCGFFGATLYILKTSRPSYNKYSVHVNCSRGSELIWRRSDTLCTSGFVDDIVFLNNGQGRARL